MPPYSSQASAEPTAYVPPSPQPFYPEYRNLSLDFDDLLARHPLNGKVLNASGVAERLGMPRDAIYSYRKRGRYPESFVKAVCLLLQVPRLEVFNEQQVVRESRAPFTVPATVRALAEQYDQLTGPPAEPAAPAASATPEVPQVPEVPAVDPKLVNEVARALASRESGTDAEVQRLTLDLDEANRGIEFLLHRMARVVAERDRYASRIQAAEDARIAAEQRAANADEFVALLHDENDTLQRRVKELEAQVASGPPEPPHELNGSAKPLLDRAVKISPNLGDVLADLRGK